MWVWGDTWTLLSFCFFLSFVAAGMFELWCDHTHRQRWRSVTPQSPGLSRLCSLPTVTLPVVTGGPSHLSSSPVTHLPEPDWLETVVQMRASRGHCAFVYGHILGRMPLKTGSALRACVCVHVRACARVQKVTKLIWFTVLLLCVNKQPVQGLCRSCPDSGHT